MKCYKCRNQASTKIGSSKGNILKALFGFKCWEKEEIYLCKKHYDAIKKEQIKKEKELAEIMLDQNRGL